MAASTLPEHPWSTQETSNSCGPRCGAQGMSRKMARGKRTTQSQIYSVWATATHKTVVVCTCTFVCPVTCEVPCLCKHTRCAHGCARVAAVAVSASTPCGAAEQRYRRGPLWHRPHDPQPMIHNAIYRHCTGTRHTITSSLSHTDSVRWPGRVLTALASGPRRVCCLDSTVVWVREAITNRTITRGSTDRSSSSTDRVFCSSSGSGRSEEAVALQYCTAI